MTFKIYYVKDGAMTFVKVLPEYLIDILNTLRKSDNINLICMQDEYGKRFML